MAARRKLTPKKAAQIEKDWAAAVAVAQAHPELVEQRKAEAQNAALTAFRYGHKMRA